MARMSFWAGRGPSVGRKAKPKKVMVAVYLKKYFLKIFLKNMFYLVYIYKVPMTLILKYTRFDFSKII